MGLVAFFTRSGLRGSTMRLVGSRMIVLATNIKLVDLFNRTSMIGSRLIVVATNIPNGIYYTTMVD